MVDVRVSKNALLPKVRANITADYRSFKQQKLKSNKTEQSVSLINGMDHHVYILFESNLNEY